MTFENLPKCEFCGEPYAKSSSKATRARFCTSTCKKYAWNERNPDAYHQTQVKRDEKRKTMRKEAHVNHPNPADAGRPNPA